MAAFQRYIGIDYSGAETPDSSIPGLRIYMANGASRPVEVGPPPGPRKYWSRREIAEWLRMRLLEDVPALVGIDHGFSFPMQYFQRYKLPLDWTAFLEDFRHHWPTDQPIYVDFVRDGMNGHGWARSGDPRWRRLTEVRARAARSVFQFDRPRCPAKSTHAGLPWLLHLRKALWQRTHFWPFDGWRIPPGRSAVAEVYPALWSKKFSREDRDHNQQDAYATAAWLQQVDHNGSLPRFLEPELEVAERQTAEIEGWIIGAV